MSALRPTEPGATMLRVGAIVFGLILLTWLVALASHGGARAQEARSAMTSPTLSSDAAGSLTVHWSSDGTRP